MNVVHEIKGDTLTLTIDLSEDNGRSKSGKNIVVASSGGFTKLGDERDTSFSLNVNRYPNS